MMNLDSAFIIVSQLQCNLYFSVAQASTLSGMFMQKADDWMVRLLIVPRYIWITMDIRQIFKTLTTYQHKTVVVTGNRGQVCWMCCGGKTIMMLSVFRKRKWEAYLNEMPPVLTFITSKMFGILVILMQYSRWQLASMLYSKMHGKWCLLIGICISSIQTGMYR